MRKTLARPGRFPQSAPERRRLLLWALHVRRVSGAASRGSSRLMVLLRELGTDFAECTTPRGALRAWVLAPNVFVTQGEGHMTDEHCKFIEAYGEERIRRYSGKLFVFHDWRELTGYDSMTRVRLTAWSVAHRQSYQEVHLAVRSRIIAMGVQVANVAVGGIMRAHSGVATLEVELARALRIARSPIASLRPPAPR